MQKVDFKKLLSSIITIAMISTAGGMGYAQDAGIDGAPPRGGGGHSGGGFGGGGSRGGGGFGGGGSRGGGSIGGGNRGGGSIGGGNRGGGNRGGGSIGGGNHGGGNRGGGNIGGGNRGGGNRGGGNIDRGSRDHGRDNLRHGDRHVGYDRGGRRIVERNYFGHRYHCAYRGWWGGVWWFYPTFWDPFYWDWYYGSTPWYWSWRWYHGPYRPIYRYRYLWFVDFLFPIYWTYPTVQVQLGTTLPSQSLDENTKELIKAEVDRALNAAKDAKKDNAADKLGDKADQFLTAGRVFVTNEEASVSFNGNQTCTLGKGSVIQLNKTLGENDVTADVTVKFSVNPEPNTQKYCAAGSTVTVSAQSLVEMNNAFNSNIEKAMKENKKDLDKAQKKGVDSQDASRQ